MATKFAYIPRYTVEDYEQWVEPNCELIQGIPYMMSPAPRIRHQRIAHRLEILLEEALAKCLECEVLPPVNYQIAEDTIVQPDLLIVCNLPDEERDVYLTTTPVLVAEIISPSSALKDRIIKRDIYESAGVRYYAVIDPDNEEIEVLVLEDGSYATDFKGREGDVSFDLGPCMASLDVGRIWQR